MEAPVSRLCITHCFDGHIGEYHNWRIALMGTSKVYTEKATSLETWGNWIKPPKEPLQVLLCDADWGGVIFPREALLLSLRLDGLAHRVPRGWRQTTMHFASGLMIAALDNVPVHYEVSYEEQMMYMNSGR